MTKRARVSGWQLVIVGLIGVAVLSAIAALFVACCIACFRLCVIAFTVLAFLSGSNRLPYCLFLWQHVQISHISAVLSATAMGVFYIIAHRVENRFIQGVVGTYEVGRAPETASKNRLYTRYSLSV